MKNKRTDDAAAANRRRYESPLRAEQAAATQRRIVNAAYRLFLDRGYPATTMADVAEAAGVAVQTVYKVFGTKSALVKRVYDVTLVGDEEPVPFARRPEVQEVYALVDPVDFVRGYARLGRLLLDRLGPLVTVLLAGARGGDADLRAWVETTNGERLVGTGMVARRLEELGGLRPGLSVERARDMLWALNSVEVWDLLVRSRGWSPQEYATWVGDAMVAAVVDPARR